MKIVNSTLTELDIKRITLLEDFCVEELAVKSSREIKYTLPKLAIALGKRYPPSRMTGWTKWSLWVTKKVVSNAKKYAGDLAVHFEGNLRVFSFDDHEIAYQESIYNRKIAQGNLEVAVAAGKVGYKIARRQEVDDETLIAYGYNIATMQSALNSLIETNNEKRTSSN